MSTATPERADVVTSLPDHTQLPDSDGSIVQNFQEHPQSILLTDSITPVLDQIHPDANYCIGQDCGIYFKPTDPPLRGVIAPDWFYVPDVPPTVDGEIRRSYVLWQELVAPLIVLEFVSGDGSEERSRTPNAGKFWLYERVIHAGYYGIYEVNPGRIEMYHSVNGRFRRLRANPHGRYSIPEIRAELGIWQGFYINLELPWMRWWDTHGNMLLTGHERAEQERASAGAERERADAERERADTERQRGDRLAAQLRALGVEPDA